MSGWADDAHTLAAGALMGLIQRVSLAEREHDEPRFTFEPIVDDAGNFTPAFRFTTELTGPRVFHVLVLREEDDWRD